MTPYLGLVDLWMPSKQPGLCRRSQQTGGGGGGADAGAPGGGPSAPCGLTWKMLVHPGRRLRVVVAIARGDDREAHAESPKRADALQRLPHRRRVRIVRGVVELLRLDKALARRAPVGILKVRECEA